LDRQFKSYYNVDNQSLQKKLKRDIRVDIIMVSIHNNCFKIIAISHQDSNLKNGGKVLITLPPPLPI